MKTKLTNQNPRSNSNGNVAILLMVFLGLAYAAYATWSYWSAENKKEKEARLIFIGNQYKAAIGRYYENSPGPHKQFPRRLEELVADGRISPEGQYMVELFTDPMGKGWGLVKDAEGGIAGVHSLSEDEPSADVDARPDEYKNGDAYARWVFQYVPLTPLAQPIAPVPSVEIERRALVSAGQPSPQLAPEHVDENATTRKQTETATLQRLPQPVGQIDVAAIQLGSGVPGIPPLANETNRHRRICIVNATRYATSCVNQPEINGSHEAIRTCVIEAQQRYEQCGGV